MITLNRAKEITNEKLDTLEKDFKGRVSAWLDSCLANGIHVYVYEGRRSNERQEELYAKGRDTDEPIVTYARAGQSFHNYGRAVDTVPLIADSKAQDMFDLDWDNESTYDKMSELAKPFNLRWLKFESGHYEDGNFASWKELKSGS